MSELRPPNPAKLIIGCLMKDKALMAQVAEKLCDKFGDMDIVSAWMSFDFTRYYEPEMGAPLFRKVIAFKKLIGQDELADIKLATNAIEDQFAENGNRRVNIDPGYLLQERFVLATGKILPIGFTLENRSTRI
jgi:hypothetical protein